MAPSEPLEHYLRQQRLTLATFAAVRAVWRRMSGDLDGSFATVGPDLVRIVAAAQLAAARSAEPYVDRAVAELGEAAPAVAELAPAAFAGVASGGGDLLGLAEQGVIRTKTALAEPGRFGGGTDTPTASRLPLALAAGLRFLLVAVQTEVADAERGATQVAMTARPRITGYTRVLNLPSCSRCAVLAGRRYAWNAGFKRHPGCDCRHAPGVGPASGSLVDPAAAYRAGKVTGLSAAQLQALDDGADIGQVVNADRAGAMSADGLWTREGTTRRGFASQTIRAGDPAAVEMRSRERGRVQRRVMRPTVAQIYDRAESREDAINLLRRTGYIV